MMDWSGSSARRRSAADLAPKHYNELNDIGIARVVHFEYLMRRDNRQPLNAERVGPCPVQTGSKWSSVITPEHVDTL